ncbi:MAG: electron transport complex subunit RsxC [Cocleimonas sp.]|nr:electron transport complex subunit RsxC [Cocleimonas sp.]
MSLLTKSSFWTFHGGVHPECHKAMSTQRAIQTLPLPKQLIIPVQQHIGSPAELLVTVGDTVFKGQPIATMASQQLGATIHAPSSGTIEAIKKHNIPHPSALDGLCVVLRLDGDDDWGDYQPIAYADLDQYTNKQLLARIETAGLVGLGGAAFPSFVKLKNSSKKGIETLIINAAECEPYISCDDMLMRERADEIVKGLQVLLRLLQPTRCLIGIEDNKPEAIVAIKKATTPFDNVAVCAIPTLYPSGGEKQLIKILTNKEVPDGGIPFDIGMLCHNIATVYSLYNAVIKGEPLLSRVVTVTGDGVKQPQNIETLIGTPVSDLIKQAGGYTEKAQRLIMGGPMMGFTLPHDAIPVVKASNCFLIASVSALQQTKSPHALQAQMPCIRCGKCMVACPVNLLPQQLYWHTQAKDFEKVVAHHLSSCIECGCCDFVCPSHIPLVSYFRFAKSELRSQQLTLEKANISRERHEFQEFRRQREKEERAEKRLKHKAALQRKKASAKGKNPKADAIKAAMVRANAKKVARAAEAKANSVIKKNPQDEAKGES